MQPIEETRRQNLARLVEEVGKQSTLAGMLDKSPAQLSQWLNRSPNSRSGRPRVISNDSAREIEQKLGKPHGWLDQPQRKTPADPPQVDVEEAPNLRSRVAVPLVGEVKGGHDGYLEETQYPVGVGEGFIVYPTSDPHAYALRVRGDSMHPRYRHGEFVVVEPSHEAQPGDDVVVRCHDGRKLLKEFGWQRQDEIQLRSINDGFEPMTLSLAEVASIHLVGGRARSGALQLHS